MAETQLLMRVVRTTAVIAMLIVVVLTSGHVFLGWFKNGYGSDAWYYPLIIALETFYILVQVWLIRVRRSTS